MDEQRVEEILAATERALDAGGPVDLRELQFWKAVEAVKRRPRWVDKYTTRIAAIDRQAFERSGSPTFPPAVGGAALTAGSLAGLLLVAATFVVSSRWKGITLLGGLGILLLTTHDLAHLLVGRAVGLRFSHSFLGGPLPLEPGLKIDYGSYLRTPPRARAWMHASGALTTKVVPFALLPVAAAAGAPGWIAGVLAGVGLLTIATDILFSTRHSDWKRFRREMRVAGDLEQAGSHETPPDGHGPADRIGFDDQIR